MHDIRRKRRATGEFRRSGSVPVERSPEDERRSPHKRARSESPEREPEKRKRTLEFGIEVKPKLQLTAKLPVLFIPFEGNFNKGNIGGFEKYGNQTSSVFERRGESPFVERGGQTISKKVDMRSTFGESNFWKKREGQLEKHSPMSSSKKGFLRQIKKGGLDAQGFYEMVAADRLARLRFGRFSDPEQGLPELIILSERLYDWPERLNVAGHKYRRCHVLDGRSLQDMAAFVLETATLSYRFETVTRSASYGGNKFVETWLIARKHTVSPAFSIACVHLSSKYTACSTSKMGSIMADILEFCRRHGVHAILGDCNLNTYGVHGGSFPVSSDFVIKDTDLALQTTFATTNGASDKAYMGGMICDTGVGFRSTVSNFGNCALPPWFATGLFSGQVFSDHHSIYANYVLFDERSDRRRSRRGVGGDCFFEALARELDTDESIEALRQRIIDGIRVAVLHDGRIDAPRSVLVQIPDTDSALPVQCPTLGGFMTEMRLAGRWMEDTLIPYVAQHLNRRIIVQYDGFYARFETDGTRQDHGGLAPHELAGLRMNCWGNHFW